MKYFLILYPYVLWIFFSLLFLHFLSKWLYNRTRHKVNKGDNFIHMYHGHPYDVKTYQRILEFIKDRKNRHE